ncbi:MAG: response regulator receiver protein [Chloroflexi bacterium HGW-Chloroflexi-6]|nr:MAG: response regulator receiver protein [Chloroflexi bacterium HGW-Chloroflexi-6]
MNNLRISLFGSVRVENDLNPANNAKLTNTISTLLAYLILYRQRAHPRDVLASLLWSDYPQERARGCLNTALWRLRQVLEPSGVPPGTFLLSTAMGELSFNCQANVWIDVVEFERIIKMAIAIPYEAALTEKIHELETTINLYKGDLLDGCYCDWALRERERLYQYYLDGLFYLLGYYHSKNQYEKAIGWGQTILMYDPLREDVHRQLMRLYVENGQRTLAVKQFHRCRDVLNLELGITPMSETQGLFEQITAQRRETLPVGQPGATEVRVAIERLQNAIETVNRAQHDLQSALERYE